MILFLLILLKYSGNANVNGGGLGGGASDIRTSLSDLNSRLVVAGAGAGAGIFNYKLFYQSLYSNNQLRL